MAPAGSSVRAVPHNRQRPAALRTIVPAIPLPYIQKKKQQQAAREKAKEEVVQPPVLEPEPSQTPPQTEITPPIANGSSDEHAPDKTEQTTDLTEATEPTEALEARDAPEATSSPMPTPIPATVKEEIQEKTNESSEASVQETEGKFSLLFIFVSLTNIIHQLKKTKSLPLLRQTPHPQHQGQLFICLLRLFLQARVTPILPMNLSSSHLITFLMDSFPHIKLMVALEALCSVVIRSRIIRPLPHLCRLAMFLHIPSSSNPRLDAMDPILQMVTTLSICPMASFPWDHQLLQATTHATTIS